jgi:hypothetical protein
VSRGQGGGPWVFPGGLPLPRPTTLRQEQQLFPGREAARRHLTSREVQGVMVVMCPDHVASGISVSVPPGISASVH